MSEGPVATAPRSPVQNLLDEVDGLSVQLPVQQGEHVVYYTVDLDDESKIHIQDLIRSAYATGVCRGEAKDG